MGVAYPIYHVSDRVINSLFDILDRVKSKFPPDKQGNLTHRPIRPDDLDPTNLTVDTRMWITDIQAANTWEPIGNAGGYTPTARTVPTGNAFVIWGWIGIDGATTIGAAAGSGPVARVKINSVIKNEVALDLVYSQPDKMLLTLDQVCVAYENSTIACQVKGADTADAVIFPLGYRIGPKEQLDVN
jgi:hypothetical protein